jgi:hypothetical protein
MPAASWKLSCRKIFKTRKSNLSLEACALSTTKMNVLDCSHRHGQKRASQQSRKPQLVIADG